MLLARRAAREAGLDGVEVLAGDASLTDSYVGVVQADLVLDCGVFGNISAPDIQHTIAGLPQLRAKDATVIWTRHHLPPDITPTIRGWFAERGVRGAGRRGRSVGALRRRSAAVDGCPSHRARGRAPGSTSSGSAKALDA